MNFLYDNFISEAIVFVFKWVVGFINDYGLTIIALTLLIKLLMLPLDLKQRASSRKMSLISAEVQSIQKRYANNPEQMNRKVSELYKERGVSPMAGCWPMLISMVFLFAFYGALRVVATEQTISIYLKAIQDGAESIQLPSWLWIRNLFQADSGMASALPKAQEFLTFVQQNASYVTPQSFSLMADAGLLSFANGTMAIGPSYDTVRAAILTANGCMQNGVEIYNNGWFVLPIIAGVSLFLQQKFTSKLSGQPIDKQPGGKMMLYFFPIFSAWICFTANAIFSIYWVMSNLFAIAITVIITIYYKRKEQKKEVTAENFRS